MDTVKDVVSDFAVPLARPPPVAEALAVYKLFAAVSIVLGVEMDWRGICWAA